MAKNNTNSNLRDLDKEINRINENHRILKEETDNVTDKLMSERDQAGEEQYQIRMKSESMKKKLVESRETLQKAKEELDKLKELADEEIKSLTAERDDSIERKLEFQLEYNENEEQLKLIQEQLSKVQGEYRQLKERSDEITDRLVIERDNACNEKHRARVRCEEVKKKIAEFEKKAMNAKTKFSKLKDDIEEITDSLTVERDECNDEIHKFNAEYDEKLITLEDLKGGIHEDDKMAYKDLNRAALKNKSTKELHTGTHDSGIEIDLAAVTRDIKTQVEIMIDEKFSKFGMKKNDTVANYITGTKSDNYETIPRSDLRGTTDEMRDLNLIIHGIEESKGLDKVFVKNLFDIVEMEHTEPTIMHRLGSKKEDRSRPMKIVMKSKSEKSEFLSKLWKLKDADTVYKKIRVTEDYTWEERQEIRRMVNMANERNENENNENEGKRNYAWKVRGTPKMGMRIVKIRVQ